VGKDPFKPLYVAPVALQPVLARGPLPRPDGSPSTGGSTSSTGGSTGSTSGSSGGTTTTPRSTGDLAAASAALQQERGLRDRLQQPSQPEGSPVHGEGAEGNSGTVFAKSFSLLSVSGKQAIVQFGDGTPFVLDLQHNTMIVN